MEKVSGQLLRKDVRFLTTLLGEVIQEQEGKRFFDTLEKIRIFAKQIRENPKSKNLQKKQNIIDKLSLDEAFRIARSFTLYFQLVNIAEEHHRVRKIRSYEQDSLSKQDMSLGKLFESLKKEKIPSGSVTRFLEQMHVGLVLTAHPTESKRRTILEHLLQISNLLNEWDSPEKTYLERKHLQTQIKSILEIMWQTRATRQRKLSVMDEVEHTLFYFTHTILDLAPRISTGVQEAFSSAYNGKKEFDFPFVRFGSWVGGDRDGNPFVTPDISYEAAKRQKETILRYYLSKIEEMIYRFSQSAQIIRVPEKLKRSIAEDTRMMPYEADELKNYDPTEVYRKKFTFIHQKLIHSLWEKKPRYDTAGEFLDDLLLVRESLCASGGIWASRYLLDRLIQQVRTFGFFLARLEFRDHQEKLHKAFAEILQWQGKTEPEEEEAKNRFLHQELTRSQKVHFRKENPGDVWEQLKTIDRIQTKINPGLTVNYLISMSRKGSDLLEMLLLAKWAGLVEVSSRGKVLSSRICFVPLFETIEDLKRAPKVMKGLFKDPLYRSYVKSLGNRQEIMLGYSDSNKNGGYLAANWQLYQTQKKLTLLAKKFGVQLMLFHGKGGTIDRGGGQSHKAIIAQPYAAPGGQMKITEQGEVISAKYSNPVIARRNIEQLLSAVMYANLVGKKKLEKRADVQAWEGVMEELSLTSMEFYRELVFQDESFLQFYREATPIELIDIASIGSRPSRRKASQQVEDLRAIPWVFSWIQSRFILSAWYGVGLSLELYCEKHGKEGVRQLQRMYRKWPFFKSLIDNVEMSLAKFDLYIAKKYAALVSNPKVRDNIMGKIEKEFERTKNLVLAVTGESELLRHQPVLNDSIRLRNPYVDPLNYIQTRLLKEYRSGSKKNKDKLKEVLLLTINGIASGMKSTG